MVAWALASALGCGVLSPDSSLAADSLLLSPADFGTAQEVQRLGERETRDGGRAAQVVLQDGGRRVFHSVVLFPSDSAARAAFRALRQGLEAERWQVVAGAPPFGQESVLLVESGQSSMSAVFREGRALVRLTVSGASDLSQVLPYVRMAEQRVRQLTRS